MISCLFVLHSFAHFPLICPNLTTQEKYHRWNRLVLNDFENIPFGLILAWSSYLAQGDATAQVVGLGLFTVGRYAHSVCYAYRLMPWRSYAFALGLAGSFTLGINAVYGAFENAPDMFA